MLGSLRDKMSHLQEGLVGTIIPPPKDQNKKDKERRIAEQAGGDVLFHFQNCWEKLHVGAEQCARQADRCDRLTSQVHAEYDKRWRHVAMLSSLVEGLPQMNTNISDIIQELRHMEILFSNVELALQNLEETIHVQETREKQQQLRFDMRVYEEKRKHELLDLEEHLKIEYNKSLKDAEARENQIKVERQSVFQKQFQQDLQAYQSTGFLDVPLVHNIDDVALESINLSGDETELEDFLNSDSTDLYSQARSRTPTESHLAVPGRKRVGKCLSGPAGLQSASKSSTSHLKSTGEKPIIKNKAAVKSYTGPSKPDSQQQNRNSVSPGLSAISLAQEVSSNTVEATAATLFAAGSMGVEMTAALGSAAGSLGNAAAGSIGSAAGTIGNTAGNVAAGTLGCAAGLGSAGYAAAGSIGSAAGTIGSTAGNVAAGTLGCAAGLGSAAVDLTAATLSAANQGINIGDEMMTDVIITSVVDSQSVVVDAQSVVFDPQSILVDPQSVVIDAKSVIVDSQSADKLSEPSIRIDAVIDANSAYNPSDNPADNPDNPAGKPGISPVSSPEEGMKSDGSMYFTPSQTMDNIKLDD